MTGPPCDHREDQCQNLVVGVLLLLSQDPECSAMAIEPFDYSEGLFCSLDKDDLEFEIVTDHQLNLIVRKMRTFPFCADSIVPDVPNSQVEQSMFFSCVT